MSTLEVRRGDTQPLIITVAGVDITGIDLWFTAKRRVTDDDADAVLLKSTGAGDITIPVGTDGVAYVALDAADTDSLTRTTRLYWDVQAVDDQAVVTTLAHGRMVIHADVTRST